MQLWLDDIRDPKDHGRAEAIWVKTAEEALTILRKGEVSFISFDHDLGTELDGHDVASEIERLVFEDKIPMPEWAVHSANPVGEAEITAAMKSAERFSNSSQNVTSNQIHVGLEIGTSKICVCVAEGMSDDTLRILGIGETPSRGVRKGEIVDPVAAAECIRMAIREAEASSGIEIKKVSVAVSGSHIQSFMSRANLIFPKAPHQISLVDTITVEQMAWDVVLPGANIVIQAIQCDSVCEFLNTNIDYQDHAVSAEYFGETCLKAAFHIIYGNRSRFQRTLDCMKSLRLEVANLVPSSLACNAAIFTNGEQLNPEEVTLVIDLGGGTTDYLLRYEGAFFNSGVLAVGGDHITNDISIGLRLPIAKAECLKIQEGAVGQSVNSASETIILKQEDGLPDYEIDRHSLDTIIFLRVREIFETIRDEAFNYDVNSIEEGDIDRVAEVVLTGGASQLQGFAELASQVFKVPVKLGHARYVSGLNKIIKNPAYTTAIGITKYAMKCTHGTSQSLDRIKESDRKPEPKREFRSNGDYLSALRKERDPVKNLSRDSSEDLDVPTFLRKGTDGVDIKHARKIE